MKKVKKQIDKKIQKSPEEEEEIKEFDFKVPKEKEVKEESQVIQLIKALIPYVIILVVVVLIRSFIVTPVLVNGPSMQPTLEGGEVMILNKLDKIERFDIVVVNTGSEDIIKRVIAMPGETISCEDGVIYVNGRKQEEDYSEGITSDFEKVTLADDEYFVMGDNRENSADSRRFGPFKESQIKGVTKLVLFPFNKFGNIE